MSTYSLHIHLHVIPYIFFSHVLLSLMDLYAVDMTLGPSVLMHISLLHASMVAHMQEPYSGFYSHMVHTCRLLWSLPTSVPLGFVITI